MRNHFFAAIIIAMLGCFSATTSRADEAGNAVIIPLDLSGGRPAVELSIDDHASALAIFDTGSIYNFLDLALAIELGLADEGLPPGPFAIEGAFATTIKNAHSGDIALPSFQAIATPWKILPDRIGLIGPNIFFGSFVTLDFAAAELRVSPKNKTTPPSGEVYAYGAPPFAMPNLEIRMGDQVISALLDTGSAYTLLFPLSDAETLLLAEPLTENGRLRGHNGEYPVFDSRIKGVVQIGPLSVENPAVRFTDAVPFANVGMEYLERMLITLDPEARQLWVSAVDQP